MYKRLRYQSLLVYYQTLVYMQLWTQLTQNLMGLLYHAI